LEKKNVMQLLHAVYDLEDLMELAMLKTHVDKAFGFLEQYGRSTIPYVGQTQGDQQFAVKWEKVKTFRPFQPTLLDKELKRMNFKILALVLTRWWSVGETARATWSSYLLLLRLTQQVINSTTLKPNKIASGLQPLILELELFSDVSLIRCFHSYF
jgi:hypothetical protein